MIVVRGLPRTRHASRRPLVAEPSGWWPHALRSGPWAAGPAELRPSQVVVLGRLTLHRVGGRAARRPRRRRPRRSGVARGTADRRAGTVRAGAVPPDPARRLTWAERGRPDCGEGPRHRPRRRCTADGAPWSAAGPRDYPGPAGRRAAGALAPPTPVRDGARRRTPRRPWSVRRETRVGRLVT
ncbi:hypothetical protein HBB16_06090 [Pseudonocardia sp. MCCB 268]|nr:hypothetical protein [Pseudonocardia cytotoxica]